MSAEIRAFQIFYNDQTRASLDVDFEPLDNSRSERPDWYEYWPIRNYLSRNQLEESAFYGFLSPRFFDKTRLSGAVVKDFLKSCGDADVVTFSPVPCHGACFVNVFEHGDFFHRGLANIAGRFFEKVNPAVKLEALVTHSRNTVFSNFFFARRDFWKSWMGVLDRLFELAETPGSELHSSLNAPLEYVKTNGERSFTHMKIFLMERAVSFLLATLGHLRVKNFPPFQMPLTSPFDGHLQDVVVLDALKIAFSETGDPHFLRLFWHLRDKAIAAAWRQGAKPTSGTGKALG